MFAPALTIWLLPPVNLALFGVLGLLAFGRWRRAGRWLSGVCLVLLLVLAMPVVSGSLIAALEQNLPLTPPADDPPGAIVVLGGDVSRGEQVEPDGPAGTDVGPLSLERVRAAADLQRRTHLPVLITGGSLAAHEPPVAAMMAAVLTNGFGVPVRWVEARSLDTWENAEFSAPILKQAGITSVYVVTQAWHMRRAIQSFRRFGIRVTAAPTRMDYFPDVVVSDFLPRASAWMQSYYGLHEWIGGAGYALF